MQLSYIHIAPAFKPGRASQKNPGASAQSFVASFHHITSVTDIAKYWQNNACSWKEALRRGNPFFL
jgi:hypothetical protein